jgi:hypothetical protein
MCIEFTQNFYTWSDIPQQSLVVAWFLLMAVFVAADPISR